MVVPVLDHLVGIEAVGLLLAGVDDNGDPVNHQNRVMSSIAAPAATYAAKSPHSSTR